MENFGIPPLGLPTTNSQPTAQPQAELEGLGQDAFMSLLLAQLQNQDPLKPMEDKEFIAQLAQFNSLNQLSQMNKLLGEMAAAQTLSQGSALIGRTVSGLSSEGESITGLVSGLKIVGGRVLLKVDEYIMPLDTVQSVQQPQE